MMNGVTNYGMQMNSQVNFQSKRTTPKRVLNKIKTHPIQSNTVKIKKFEKEINPKIEEIMSKLKEGQITYSEALDALINLERSVPMQIKKFEAFV